MLRYDDVGDSIEDKLNVAGVRGAGGVRVNRLPVGILVELNKLIADKVHTSLVVSRTWKHRGKEEGVTWWHTSKILVVWSVQTISTSPQVTPELIQPQQKWPQRKCTVLTIQYIHLYTNFDLLFDIISARNSFIPVLYKNPSDGSYNQILHSLSFFNPWNHKLSTNSTLITSTHKKVQLHTINFRLFRWNNSYNTWWRRDKQKPLERRSTDHQIL